MPFGTCTSVQCLQVRDGRLLLVIVLPPPQYSGEEYFIGLLLPLDQWVQKDARAWSMLRFFILQKYGSERPTDFCEWTAKGKLLTYNIGSIPAPEAFAELIEQRIAASARKRARTATT